jgi:hypothetical protein
MDRGEIRWWWPGPHFPEKVPPSASLILPSPLLGPTREFSKTGVSSLSREIVVGVHVAYVCYIYQ